MNKKSKNDLKKYFPTKGNFNNKCAVKFQRQNTNNFSNNNEKKDYIDEDKIPILMYSTLTVFEENLKKHNQIGIAYLTSLLKYAVKLKMLNEQSFFLNPYNLGIAPIKKQYRALGKFLKHNLKKNSVL